MARGRIITPEVEALIRRVHLNNPKMKANEVRNLVKSELKTKETYSALWPIPKEWPSLSKVQKVLAKVIREQNELSEEEKKQEEPWDISTLGKYPIPPEAVPVVLKVSMQSQQPLTIREAKWIGRLYVLIGAIASRQNKAPTIAFVAGMATYYATTERINILMGERAPATMDEILWDFLTGRESMDEVAKRGFNPGSGDDRFRKGEDGQWHYLVTREELNKLRKMQSGLDLSWPFGPQEMENIGGQNERQHKTKRQK